MADGIRITEEGIKEIEVTLKQLEADIQFKILGSSLRSGAKPVVESAKIFASRYDHETSGSLAEAIKIKRVSKSRSRGAISFMVGVDRNDQIAAGKYASFYGNGGSGVFHAHLVELGVPSRGIAAQPFLRPAMDSTTSQVDAVFFKNVGKKVGAALRKRAKLTGKE